MVTYQNVEYQSKNSYYQYKKTSADEPCEVSRSQKTC